MCYALLIACTQCSWFLHISYPRCSHAKAYGLDPQTCPGRMKRKHKKEGLCRWCQARAGSLGALSWDADEQRESKGERPKPTASEKTMQLPPGKRHRGWTAVNEPAEFEDAPPEERDDADDDDDDEWRPEPQTRERSRSSSPEDVHAHIMREVVLRKRRRR